MPPPESTAPKFRPPDFLLPKPEKTGSGPRTGGPEIYLTWGGEVYGPAAPEEVVSGVRTSWFEPGTLYWHEGRDEWRPVGEFPPLHGEELVPTTEHPARPAPPTDQPRARDHRPRRLRIPRGRRARGRGIGFIMIFIIAAAALTVGILLLLMLV